MSLFRNKVMSAREAVGLIKDGDCVAISSAGLVGYPEYIAMSIEEAFKETGHPASLTLYSGCGHGTPARYAGDAHFTQPGMLSKVICAHPKPVKEMMDLIARDAFPAYILPQGVMQQLYRCAAAKQPGILTKIGMGTFMDPRQSGGRANPSATEEIVRIMELDGEEWLFYKSFPVTIAIIRGTTADEFGNVSIEKEALKLELLEIAEAAKASGGKVIVQVEHTTAAGTIDPKMITVPGEMVDAVVVCPDSRYHMQTEGTVYNPYFTGALRAPANKTEESNGEHILNSVDVVCRRAAYELYPNAVVNVGIGIGSGIGAVAREERIEDKLTFTLELGAFGGAPQAPPDFGASENPTAFIAHPSMFDFYHGGGLDIAFLGVAQVDKYGNVNASMFGGQSSGQGGFIDISQSCRKTVFCTYFKAKGLDAAVKNGKLVIQREGALPKFVEEVDQITFNGQVALSMEKKVLYVTERCVFELTDNGLLLTEVAPGVDLEKDIFAQMEFRPLVSDNLKIMNKSIFTPGKMGLLCELFKES